MTVVEAIELVDDPARAAAALSPVRRRLLAELAEPVSAPRLAERLGLPRQRVGYHLKELERAGFVECVATRQRRGCVERLMRTTARTFVVDPAVLGPVAETAVALRDRFSWARLVAVAARTLSELSILRRRADAASLRLATLTLDAEVRFADADAQTAFAEELTEAWTRVCARYDRPDAADGRSFRVLGAVHPKITKSEAEATAEAARRGSSSR